MHDETTLSAQFTRGDLEEMVLRLAHEVRNPLATIKSSAQLMRRLKMPPEDALAYLESIIIQVGRIDNTIQEMERFTRLRQGSEQPVSLEDAVAGVLESKMAQSMEAGVNLEDVSGPALRILVDPQQFHIALDELVDNAIRFSRPDTVVTVSWESENDGFVSLHVDDQGAGVAKDVAPRILCPFFSSSTQGTGLGLNTVQRICRLAGGRLEWYNRNDVGCRFSMILPRN